MNQNRSACRRGAVAVEFAVTAPILFLLLFGAYELSRANMIMHTCEAAAYEGARVGILPGATVAEIENAVNRTVSSVGIQNVTIDTSPNNLNVDTETVAVTVQVRFSDNTVLAPVFVGSQPFVRTCEMTRESF